VSDLRGYTTYHDMLTTSIDLAVKTGQPQNFK
jgi:hypothetical protein